MTNESTQQEEEEQKATDVADRLLRIIAKIEHSSQVIKYENSNGSKTQACHKKLFEVFGDIAEHLGFETYSDLHDNFSNLCKRVERDVTSLPFRREGARGRIITAINNARAVFDAENFGEQCSSVFKEHFSTDVKDRLEDASNSLQLNDLVESSPDELKEALDAARAALGAYETEGNIPPQLSKILKHYIQQIESAYQMYEDFGEEAFWPVYKELLATFAQVHPIIMGDKKSEVVSAAVKDMGSKLQYGITALSITANVAAIGSFGVGILQIASN